MTLLRTLLTTLLITTHEPPSTLNPERLAPEEVWDQELADELEQREEGEAGGEG